MKSDIHIVEMKIENKHWIIGHRNMKKIVTDKSSLIPEDRLSLTKFLKCGIDVFSIQNNLILSTINIHKYHILK